MNNKEIIKKAITRARKEIRQGKYTIHKERASGLNIVVDLHHGRDAYGDKVEKVRYNYNYFYKYPCGTTMLLEDVTEEIYQAVIK